VPREHTVAEVAIPFAAVASTSEKLPPHALKVARGPLLGAVKVTVAPLTGWPEAVKTRACNRRLKLIPLA
jgi:hypothetical protein